MRFPLLSKSMALGCVLLGLLWALLSVQSIVQERQSRRDEAERNVAGSLAASQTLLGPVLSRVCTETWVASQIVNNDARPVVQTRTREVRLPSAQLKLSGTVEMTPRYRGMFKVNGYGVKTLLHAHWPDVSRLTVQAQHDNGKVSCEAPVLSVSLSDARGIRLAEVLVNARPAKVRPGSAQEAQPRGFHAVLDDSLWPSQGALAVNLNLELAGTRKLSVVPLADTTHVTLRGDWPHPSFGGRFLPTGRQVGPQGFDATWKVTSLASSAQQEWLKGAPLCAVGSDGELMSHGLREGHGGAADTPTATCVESFGVDFIDPINPYVLGDRATKYGVLFIVLTFVAVGLVEVLRQLRVHPIQYLLVGAALAVFFLLLVSLSEHMAFGIAYAVAAGACTLLLAFYGSFVLRGALAGLAFGGGIAGLFATLYALLQMEQTALVMGSVLLFVVLAMVMVATRKLDWYALMARLRSEDSQAALPTAEAGAGA